MSPDAKKPWFAAKLYGLGWGLPMTWQGWLVLVAYFVLLIGGIAILREVARGWAVIAWVVVLSIALGAIVAAKGERPLRWRWGRK